MAKFELKNHVFPLPRDYKEDGQVKIGTFSKAYMKLITKEKGDLIDSAKEVIAKALLGTAATKTCECDCAYPVTLEEALLLFANDAKHEYNLCRNHRQLFQLISHRTLCILHQRLSVQASRQNQ